MKDRRLTEEEIGSIILAKEALSKLGCGSMINVSSICKAVGISRKSAYSYYRSLEEKKKTEEIKNREKDDNAKEQMFLRERIKKLEVENKILKVLKKGIEDLKKKGYLDK